MLTVPCKFPLLPEELEVVFVVSVWFLRAGLMWHLYLRGPSRHRFMTEQFLQPLVTMFHLSCALLAADKDFVQSREPVQSSAVSLLQAMAQRGNDNDEQEKQKYDSFLRWCEKCKTYGYLRKVGCCNPDCALSLVFSEKKIAADCLC